MCFRFCLSSSDFARFAFRRFKSSRLSPSAPIPTIACIASMYLPSWLCCSVSLSLPSYLCLPILPDPALTPSTETTSSYKASAYSLPFIFASSRILTYSSVPLMLANLSSFHCAIASSLCFAWKKPWRRHSCTNNGNHSSKKSSIMPEPVKDPLPVISGDLLVTSHIGCSPPLNLTGWLWPPFDMEASTNPVKKW